MDHDIVDNPMSLYNPNNPRSLLDIMMESINIYEDKTILRYLIIDRMMESMINIYDGIYKYL